MTENTLTAKVVGFESLRAKMLRIIKSSGEATLLKANQKNADEFAALVRSAVPQDPHPLHGHIVDTLHQARVGAVGVEVSIGDADHKYPLHLEAGHKFPNGTLAPPRPYWLPSKRVVKKRSHARIIRAERAAIKAAAAS